LNDRGAARRVYVCTIDPAGVNRKVIKRPNYFLTIIGLAYHTTTEMAANRGVTTTGEGSFDHGGGEF
jgi:hypothetical protein